MGKKFLAYLTSFDVFFHHLIRTKFFQRLKVAKRSLPKFGSDQDDALTSNEQLVQL